MRDAESRPDLRDIELRAALGAGRMDSRLRCVGLVGNVNVRVRADSQNLTGDVATHRTSHSGPSSGRMSAFSPPEMMGSLLDPSVDALREILMAFRGVLPTPRGTGIAPRRIEV